MQKIVTVFLPFLAVLLLSYKCVAQKPTIKPFKDLKTQERDLNLETKIKKQVLLKAPANLYLNLTTDVSTTKKAIHWRKEY
jgi:hypothetical protein